MAKKIVIRVNETGAKLEMNEPNDVWVFCISKKTNHYGLAFSDANWKKRTLLISSDNESLNQKAQVIRMALSRNAASVAI